MKSRQWMAVLALAAWSFQPSTAQISMVNPVPQQVEIIGNALLEAPNEWVIKYDASRKETVALATLRTAGVKESSDAHFTITLGLIGDKAVKRLKGLVPAKAEGYYLELTEKGATIAARDEQGLFYGVKTLLASISHGKLQTARVTDFPDIPFRGTVEGFYGTPWSHEARLSQISFYGDNKMNVYIYGPKDDPWHRDKWREAYPEVEANRIKQLNEHARRNGVNFYWAIHPGVDIKWTTEDRELLIAKLEKMYNLGIRSFAVFFDDIWGEGAKADKQAELLNYIDDRFIATHKDIAPLIMCPTEYNKSWANEKGGYLRTLGQKMNKDIQIMWTGNTVVHCIDKPSMEWINERIERKAYIWWNFPVSDFVRDRVLLGPAYGNGLDIAEDVSGFVSNPMEHAEASKISLYGIADYTWNMKAYNYQRDWERGLHALLPSNAEALRTFALYNKDLGPNGHGFRREEGEELVDIAEKAISGDKASVKILLQKSLQLGVAADLLLADKDNPRLIRELRPWLLQAKNVADYGSTVCTMALSVGEKDHTKAFPTFEDIYARACSLREQMYNLENSSELHPHQTGVKLAEKVFLPTLGKLFTKVVDSYNKANGTNLENVADYNPFRLTSDVPQLALLPISVRGNEVSIAASNEVIKWASGASLTIESDREITLAGMDFNLGKADVARYFRLECYNNGKWHEVCLLHYKADDPVIHTGNELGGMHASKLRLTNISDSEQQVYFRQFKFIKQ